MTEVARPVGSRGELCLNVGCGLSCGPSWLNVDASYSLRIARLPMVGGLLARLAGFPAWPSRAVYGDVARGLSVPPGSCRLIFASHVLEHLSEADFRAAIRNLYAYLAPGGWLRCLVPDLEVLARDYATQVASSDRRMAASASSRFLQAANLGSRESRSRLASRLRSALSNSAHQWMWDRVSLEDALRGAGFGRVVFRRYGDWADERFREVEEESRHAASLCAEAWKPDA